MAVVRVSGQGLSAAARQSGKYGSQSNAASVASHLKKASGLLLTLTGTAIADVPDSPIVGAITNVGTARAYNNGAVTLAYTAAVTGGAPTTFTATSSPGSFTGTGTSPITITGLQSGTAYTYTIVASNAVASSPASAAYPSTLATTIPQAPTIGTATNPSGGSISVAFTPGATGGSSITLYTVLSTSGASTTGVSSPIALTETVSGAYTYTIKATNANGDSSYSSASNSLTIVLTITDNFTRTTTLNLGTSSSGTTWNALRGVWSANGSQAVSADAASTYPVASAGASANITASADVSGGTGLVFWATDANNWWASYPSYVQNSSTTCNAGYTTTAASTSVCCSSYTTNSGSSSCTGYTGHLSSSPSGCCDGVVTYPSTTTYPYAGSASSVSTIGGVVNGTCPSGVLHTGTSVCYDCSGYSGGFNGPTPLGTGTAASCYTTLTTATTYSCNRTVTTAATYNCYTSTTTSYTYDTRIVVISSVSGSVVTDSTTTLVSAAGSLSPINSLKVVTVGNQITATGYSTAGLVSALGSPVVRTPTSPTMGTNVGIIVAPTTYNQGATLDNFSAQA